MNEKETIIVNGYAYPTISPDTLSAWLPALTLVSSFSYGFRPDGSLIDLQDENIIEPARAAGVGGLMALTSLDENDEFSGELVRQLFETPGAPEKLVDNILNTLRTKDLFGVDLDFQYVLAQNRDQYTDFIAYAAERCNEAGFLVTVALAPKISADQKGQLYEGHDYHGIGQAANFVLLMTYEWGYAYGPPLPIAPLPAVRQVIEYGVSEIPADKILMGIPNYGYDWMLPFIPGQSRARKISNTEAVLQAERLGIEIDYSEEFEAPYYYYTDSNGQEHVVWFENERSWQAKFNLVKEYNLAGISIWNIVDPFPAGQAVLLNNFYPLKV